MFHFYRFRSFYLNMKRVAINKYCFLSELDDEKAQFFEGWNHNQIIIIWVSYIEIDHETRF